MVTVGQLLDWLNETVKTNPDIRKMEIVVETALCDYQVEDVDTIGEKMYITVVESE